MPSYPISNGTCDETFKLELKSLPGRLRTRASANTPFVSSSHFQPLLRAERQLSFQLRRWFFPVNEVAKTTSYTSFATVEPAAGLAKICDG
jgi:hypothetical protein